LNISENNNTDLACCCCDCDPSETDDWGLGSYTSWEDAGLGTYSSCEDAGDKEIGWIGSLLEDANMSSSESILKKICGNHSAETVYSQ
jgi:hypothetical protein